jgi:stress-induced morphogen
VTREQLAQRVWDVLKKNGFAGDTVEIREGDASDDLFLTIISPKFAGKRWGEKGSLISSVLFQDLVPEEWGRISLIQSLTPEKAQADWDYRSLKERKRNLLARDTFRNSAAAEKLKQKIRSALRPHFPEDTIDVSDALKKGLCLIVVSRRFDGLSREQKKKLIRDLLAPALTPSEQAKVSDMRLISPEAIKQR